MKAEFRRRLERLDSAIEKALANDSLKGDILPALFSAASFCWCKDPSLKKDN